MDYEPMWQELGLDVKLHRELLQSLDRTFRQQVQSQRHRPREMAYFDEAFHSAHGARVAEIMAHKATGGKFVGTFCIFVPEEIVLALGAIPMALCGGTAFSLPYAEERFPRDICPLIKSTLGLAFSRTCPYAPLKDLAVGETTCDAKKKTWDLLAQKVPFHIMEVPQKKQERDQVLWREEVGDFARRVEEVAGQPLEPQRLAEAIALLNRKRRALSALHAFRREPAVPISGLDALLVTQVALIDDPVRFCEHCEALCDELAGRVEEGISVVPESAPRLIVSGCPSVMGNTKLHHVIETSGAVVVCDESCTGTRNYDNLVSEEATDLEGQLTALAERYLRLDCACFSPNTERTEKLLRLVDEYSAQGVVHYILQYCHGYNVEEVGLSAALKRAGVPSLKLETDYAEEDTAQLRVRLEAFLEVVGRQ